MTLKMVGEEERGTSVGVGGWGGRMYVDILLIESNTNVEKSFAISPRLLLLFPMRMSLGALFRAASAFIPDS